jgi:hypothetical protein
MCLQIKNKISPKILDRTVNFPDFFHNSRFIYVHQNLNTGLAAPLLSFLTTQMPQRSERNGMSPATFAVGP